jgi:hypothetical protein
MIYYLVLCSIDSALSCLLHVNLNNLIRFLVLSYMLFAA